MPYVKQITRDVIGPPDLCGITACGDLNYKITNLIHRYIIVKGLSYSTLNEVTGVLECAKLELYRQVVAKYEDKKKRQNGPVSELDSRTLEDVR